MEKKKNIFIILFFALTVFLFSYPKVYVANAEVHSDNEVENYFSGLSNDSYVHLLPDGTIISNINGDNNFSEKSVNDYGGQVLKVSEAKKIYKNLQYESLKPEEIFKTLYTRSANPNDARLIILEDKQQVRSSAFSGSGWRYAEKKFLPKPGTGDYLYWQTVGDDGRVADYNTAYFLWRDGKLGGNTITRSQGRIPLFCNARVPGYMYFTYNPINGSYYIVDNGR